VVTGGSGQLALPVPAAGRHPRNAAAWPCAVRAAG